MKREDGHNERIIGVMEMKKKTIKSVLSSRKFKYGSVAVAFTAVFCVFVILLNAVLTVVSDYNGGFFIDLTNEQIYDLSDTSLEVINNLDKNVEIIFSMTADKIDEIDVLAYIKRLAEKYDAASDKITVVYKDCVKDPIYFNQFKKTSSDRITQYSIIVNCAETKRFVVYDYVKFFKLSYETGGIFAYDGENKFTGAILQTAETQTAKAGIITNHGEKVPSAFETLLREQGYEVSGVDLEKIEEDVLFEYDLLVISNPKYDYTGIAAAREGGRNEIGLLNDYITEHFGNLMVFIDYQTSNTSLSEFSGFLADDWGVGYNYGEVILEDSSKIISDSDETNRLVYKFLATPSTTGYGAKIAANIDSGANRAAFGVTTTPLSILFTEKGEKTVSPVFTTSAKAIVYRGDTERTAAFEPVMTLTTYTKMKDNNEQRANVLVCGSTDYLNDIDSQQYSNGDVIKSALKEMGGSSVVSGIDYKVLEETSIVITQDVFEKYMVLLSSVVPLIIAAIGVAVYVKRKKA